MLITQEIADRLTSLGLRPITAGNYAFYKVSQGRGMLYGVYAREGEIGWRPSKDGQYIVLAIDDVSSDLPASPPLLLLSPQGYAKAQAWMEKARREVERLKAAREQIIARQEAAERHMAEHQAAFTGIANVELDSSADFGRIMTVSGPDGFVGVDLTVRLTGDGETVARQFLAIRRILSRQEVSA